MMYAPLPLFSLFKNACPGLLTGHLLLDLDHARFSQDLHIFSELVSQNINVCSWSLHIFEVIIYLYTKNR